MKLCDRCRVSGCCLNYLGEPCKRARKRECPDVVYTNADRIRDMTDEDMAIFLSENSWGCNECKSGQENMDNPFATRCDEKCAEHCLEWLQQPY